MHVDIGVAEYNIEIGPSLIGPLIRELEEDPDNNLIVIDKAVANHLKKIHANINGLNVIELTAGKESKTFYALTNIFSTMEKLNIQKSDKLKKQELVYKILDEQALKPNDPKAPKKEDSSSENKVVATSNDNQKDSNSKLERTNPSTNNPEKQASNHPRNNNNQYLLIRL